MTRKPWLCAALVLLFNLLLPSAIAQYASPAAEANSILVQISQASTDAQRDVAQLRIDKWKIDGDAKRRAESRAESISRNLAAALPGMLDAIRVAPNSLAAKFKLYRNLSALNDPMAALADDASSGPKEDRNALTSGSRRIGARCASLWASAWSGLPQAPILTLPSSGPGSRTRPPPAPRRSSSTTPSRLRKSRAASQPLHKGLNQQATSGTFLVASVSNYRAAYPPGATLENRYLPC